MAFSLQEKTVERVRQVLERYPQVTAAVLYGSRAKGNARPGSDIDLTLHGDGLDLNTLNRIRLDLDDLLLPYTFDVSSYAQIDNPALLDHIARVGVPFYHRTGAETAPGVPLSP